MGGIAIDVAHRLPFAVYASWIVLPCSDCVAHIRCFDQCAGVGTFTRRLDVMMCFAGRACNRECMLVTFCGPWEILVVILSIWRSASLPIGLALRIGVLFIVLIGILIGVLVEVLVGILVGVLIGVLVVLSI